jgi:lipopolysaccharide/colanic/teichoic acid biosynthesis glycosyltransferase/glycosyltransferase involved in cell wall biosynthesis
MKNQDDGTLSLFDDFPPAFDPATLPPAAPAKKPRAKRKAAETKVEVADTHAGETTPTSTTPAVVTEATSPASDAAQQTPASHEPAPISAESATSSNDAVEASPTKPVFDHGVNVEKTLHLAGLVEPQRRRNSPWASLDLAALQAKAQVPRVMIVITRGEAGGAQSHVRDLCKALQTRVRFTVVIGGPVEESVLGRELTALGITVCPMPDMVESLNPLKLWPAVQQLTALIHTHKPDIVHGHSAIGGLVARIAAKRAHVPAVYTVHGFGFKPEVPLVRRTAAALAERMMAHWTTQMICVSKYERELAFKLDIASERVHIIPNGIARLPASAVAAHVDGESISANDMANTHAASAQNTPTVPRIIMVARMKRPKRHDLLLQALAKVRNTLGHELHVTFAGDGPLNNVLHAQAKELNLKNITWAGDVSHVSELLAQHEVFVLLSEHEGMPITVLEAMRAGLCVLASNLPGIREQVNTYQDGVLTANTPDAVAEKLLQLVRDPHLRKRLGRAAQQTFESAFAAEPMAERVLQVYRQCTPATHAAQTNNESTSTHSAGLVSASVRRRDALQRWALWGVWMLLPSLMAAQLFEDAGVMTYQFGETLWWCVLPYAIATHLLMRASHLPVAERSGVLWVSTTAPFLFTPLGFALLQQPYSRAAVVWAYAATTLWLWWGYRRHVKHRALRLVHLDANVPAQLAACMSPNTLDLQAVQLIAWNPNTDAPLPACDGVVLDRHVRSTDERTRLLGELKMQHLRLYSVEAVAELTSGRKMLPTAADSLWEIDNDPSYDRAKRLLDVATVIALAPLWLPLAAGVALAVRFDSKGPALYSQPRVGRDGQVFTLWKFRSMVHGLQAPGVHFAQAEDPRITRVGRLLRRSRLDELPQLFNVLMGHMSLIGPRPEQTAFVRDFAATIPSYPYRHLVRPGLTGWAQVQQGYADSADTTRIKLSYDLYYVAHYSLALDLLIAAKTVKTVCTGFGAR